MNDNIYLRVQKYMDIDTRKVCGIPPFKIEPDRCKRLEDLLCSHDGIFYNAESQSLHLFRLRGHHLIRRPLKIDFFDDNMWVFNSHELPHSMEIYSPSGVYISTPTSDPWMTEMRVLLMGSSLSRMINLREESENIYED
jgi:hypothetical protein